MKQETKARELISGGNLIGAVKLIRDANGISLKQSKDLCEQWRDEQRAYSSLIVAGVRQTPPAPVAVVESDKTTLGKLETVKHIHRVRFFLFQMIVELDARSRAHDLSKLESPEAEIFGEFTPELAKVEYDSPEYRALLEKVRPATDHHYAKNRHHPEHWPNGVGDMTLVDMVEMLCDWKAATERNKNGNIRTSIEKNTVRYGLSPQLAQIMQNTVREMFQE